MTAPISKLQELAISDTGFVFDPVSGYSFTVNQTGLFILRCLKEGLSTDEIVPAVEAEFEVGEADVYRDCNEFLLLLKKNNLVPEDA
jgi:hypothetical protein